VSIQPVKAAQDEYDAVMSGLREYHTHDKDPKLPYIHRFYERNRELFHFREFATRFTPAQATWTPPQRAPDPPQYPINSQALTLRQSNKNLNLSSSSPYGEPQRHVSFSHNLPFVSPEIHLNKDFP
jgi:hypothetical protein